MSSVDGDCVATRWDNLFAFGLKGIGICDTVYSQIVPTYHFPYLPTFCGAVDHELPSLFDDQPRNSLNNRSDLLAQAGIISELLRNTDVSYLVLKNDAEACIPCNGAMVEDLDLCREVLQCDLNAFECNHGELNLDEMTPTLQEESTTKDDQGKSKRKLAFNVPVPRKRRTKTSGRGPRQRSSPVWPELSPTDESDSPISTTQPSHWLLMLSYKILTGNDPRLARTLTEIASSMDDSKWDLLGTRLELVKVQDELREAKQEACKSKKEARIMGEEMKAVKDDMENQVKTVKSLNLQLAQMRMGICQAVKKFIHLDPSVVESVPDQNDFCGVKIYKPPPC